MPDNHGTQIRCPQCATLYEANPAGCPHCGLPSSGEGRQQHIEQLLHSMAQTPDAPSPIRNDPASLAFSGHVPVPDAPQAALQWEKAPQEPAAGEPRPFRSRRLIAVLVGGFLLLIAIVIALAFALRAALGYRATPETLIAGLQQAMEEGDARLYMELAMPKGTDIESLSDLVGENITTELQSYSLQYSDVILSESGNTALVIATLQTKEQEDTLSSIFYPSGTRLTLLLYREDGRWYIDANSAGILRGLQY